jgi:hypothetical protein
VNFALTDIEMSGGLEMMLAARRVPRQLRLQ